MTTHDPSASLVLQRPAGAAAQLVLLFHGLGGRADDMAPLGARLAEAFPRAFVVSVGAAQPGDRGAGRQWFPATELTESNRVERVRDAMPAFVAAVEHWKREANAGHEQTALVGFSQGAVMALEASKISPSLAGRVVAISGRFAELPERASPDVTIHLIHGKADAVIHYGLAVTAAEHLVAIGADVTADVLPFVGHEIGGDVASLLLERLTGHLPLRRWREAMQAMPAATPPRRAGRLDS